ncbi:hypothetical protein AM501_14240 [Aneurinibacillus migulanus]|uniref:hypothetical protein n=1 Tax=Aneurinibacillus migulanus TaxID=47500 RepID=UPI0005BAE105|nr:hypothetical protein [Aneurinibacillus migulanus]KIV50531.1 hypothetical protein TS64_28675 [Aneurinibacillus migulanus]KPD07713.1 hypothetical protein AM501_14240 [Aneurinibacillus migulanus]
MTTIVARNKGKETTKTVRKKTPIFVLTLPLHVEHFQAKQLDVRFEIARKIYNACIKELYRRYHLLCQSTEYQRIMKQIRATYRKEEKGRYLNQKNRTNQAVSLEHVRRPLWKEKQALHEKYGLNEYSLHAFVQPMAAYFKRHMDTYAQMALCSRVKYCRLKRIVIRGAVRYIVQLMLEGIPPRKLDKQGQFKHTIGQGKTGCDIGTQTAIRKQDHCSCTAGEENNCRRKDRKNKAKETVWQVDCAPGTCDVFSDCTSKTGVS